MPRDHIIERVRRHRARHALHEAGYDLATEGTARLPARDHEPTGAELQAIELLGLGIADPADSKALAGRWIEARRQWARTPEVLRAIEHSSESGAHAAE